MGKHRIEPARRKPGIGDQDLPGPRPSDTPPQGGAPRQIRGRALIFWDPKVPGKKRDAIDTDQITPAADCVSESLETLDERWKAGSFRHLMPDFRQRVHRGRDVPDRRRAFRDRVLARDEPGGIEGSGRRKGPRAGHRHEPRDRRHLPPKRLQPRPACGPVPGGGRRRRRRRLLRLRPRDPPPHQRDAAEILRAARAFGQGRGDPRGRRHLRGRAARIPRVGAVAPRDRLARPGDRPPHDHDRADRLGAPRRP